ncbi:unnamed protein product [Arabidopsis halleri]
MGIIAFDWAENRLTVLQNRDEQESRQVVFIDLFLNVNEAAWLENDNILAGLGNPDGGTWLGCSRRGRVAFLLDSIPWPRHPTRRGEHLTLDFIEGTRTPDQFAEDVIRMQNKGLTFHLVVADVFGTKSLVYICKKKRDSDHVTKTHVPYGVHTITTNGIDKGEEVRRKFAAVTEWTHSQSLELPTEMNLRQIILELPNVQRTMNRLQGIKTPDDHDPIDLTSFFKRDGPLQTNCSTVVVVVPRAAGGGGRCIFHEKYMRNHRKWDEKCFFFDMAPNA